MIQQAKENIILRRDTHIDQLADKLRENRVRKVIEPILAGLKEPEQIPTDDLYYARDLGLIKYDDHIRVSNRIYSEVIPRELIFSTQVTITEETSWYVLPDGRLDMNKLIKSFQVFFREHSEHWMGRFDYKEAGPQLLLQAFLQRIINSGGSLEREYGLGRMRTDLFIKWPFKAHSSKHKFQGNKDIQKIVIELKILYKSLEKTVKNGLEQTSAYMERCGADEGHLLIFDRDSQVSWDKKIFHRLKKINNREIQIWGM